MDTLERKAIAALFFLFGGGIMCWIPRFPEVKENLNVNNGQFGTLISASAIGALISFLVVGEFVHRYGSGLAMTLSATIFCLAIGLIVHATHPWQFLICNICVGAGVSAFHISINAQVFHLQSQTQENLLARMHGAWSAGSLITAIFAGFLTGRVSLWVHVDTLLAITYALMLFLLWKTRESLMPGSKNNGGQTSLHALFSSFKVDWVITLAVLFSQLLEHSIADWATIFSKEELHMSPGVSTIPFIAFALAMILGRLNVHRVTEFIPIAELVKRSVIFCGLTFIAGVALASYIAHSLPTLGLAVFILVTFIAGLGSSILAPTLFNTANKRSSAPGSVVLGRLGLLTTIMTFVSKSVIAWVAQYTSISIAFLIPSLALLATACAVKAIRKANL